MVKNCTSCGKKAITFVKFNCPSCNEVEIIRCHHCRMCSTNYTCSKCGFQGP